MPSWFDKLSGRAKKIADKATETRKPEPKDIGTGYAAKAATAVSDRNKKIAEVAKELDHYKKGGKVKRSGLAVVHKGELVLTQKQTKNPIIKTAVKKSKKNGGK